MIIEPFDRRIVLARHHQRAALAIVGFTLALPVTLMSSSFVMSLIGAGGLFASGLVTGYQAARIGQAAAGQRPVNNSHR